MPRGFAYFIILLSVKFKVRIDSIILNEDSDIDVGTDRPDVSIDGFDIPLLFNSLNTLQKAYWFS